ncbi:MAG: methyltransferase domain-containing protein [Geodermatophilaceae bacterium]|nr:methyltransferase domain-containing protein [Geodermatophilaceae bacterium]
MQLHEISEAGHRILDPYTDDKLMLLGRVAHVGSGTRILDLASGKGELLCRWAEEFGTTGHGVDISEVFLAAARARAEELGVGDRVSFELGDAGEYVAEPASYDVVSCLGATWIGGGLAGTVALMLPAVRPGGLLLVGEPYWSDPPPEAAYAAMGLVAEDFASLGGTADRLATAGTEVVEMVLADGDSWDRYAAAQWWALSTWLRDNPDDPRRAAVQEFLEEGRRTHLEYQRRYFGWGVFVLRPSR